MNSVLMCIVGAFALLLFAVVVLYAIHHRRQFRTSVKVPFANFSFEATDQLTQADEALPVSAATPKPDCINSVSSLK